MGCPFEFSPLNRSAAVRVPATFAHRLVILAFAATAASGFFPATVNLVDSGPGPTLGLAIRNPATLVAFLYVLSLPLLLVGVLGFVSAWHRFLPVDSGNGADTVPRDPASGLVAVPGFGCHFQAR